ncbi:MAG: HAD-IG family 5'-nucleotidase [Bdellovibrionales bacterium]|nr:HAD-IG family 5'-nucleotidase [Bdellovibrionales bacterium]
MKAQTGRVYVNRTLNLKRINYIGFDMDHTLIRYNSRAFEELTHRVLLNKLIQDKGYPDIIRKLAFDFDQVIRGLVIDIHRGNILKLSRHAAIRVSYHGLTPITYSQQRKLYKSAYVDLGDPGFEIINTTFSIAFCGLFAQLVDLKDKLEHQTLPDYGTIAGDLNSCLDRAHRDGSLKDEVANNLDTYIVKDEEVVRGLQRYKMHGKKIFIVTNSDFHYTKLLLDYSINPYLKGETWEKFFEIVITSADKPRFFYDNLKFLKINPSNGTMTNLTGKIGPGVYQGGCANIFTSDLNLTADEILYIGDHIYGDVVRLKKDCAWRTALVVEELGDEIDKLTKAQPFIEQINQLMEQKLPLEIEIDQLISAKIENGKTEVDETINRLLGKISEIDKRIAPLIKSQQEIFNARWGDVMRVGIEESFFAYQMERYACIYMAKIKDLLELSPRTYFRSAKRLMPHEVTPQLED